MSGDVFFSGWSTLARTALISILAYPAMLVILRLSGQRTLSKMNAFDLVVTIALGSTLASVILTGSVALAQGLLAFVLLIAMQYLLALLTSRSPVAERWVNGEPVLLFHRGTFLHQAMRKARVTEEEVRAGIRQQGRDALADIEAVVLETNGRLSVIPVAHAGQDSALAGVPGRQHAQTLRGAS